MSNLTTLYALIGDEIYDPGNVEVATGAASRMLRWINVVAKEAARLTDCLQTSDTFAGDSSAESFVVSALTRYWHTLNIIDKANDNQYEPVTREEYLDARGNIVVNSIGSRFIYNVFGYDATQKVYILPVVATGSTITIEHSQLHSDVTDAGSGAELLLGQLNEEDPLIIKGVASLYWYAVGELERAQEAFQVYFARVQSLAREVGINPQIAPEMSQLYRGLTDANSR